MAKQCQSEYTTQRRLVLQQSLLALLHNQSFQDISVKDICQHAAIPRRTFYHYFNGKEDLMDDLIAELIQECDLACVPDFFKENSRLRQSFEQFFTFWGKTRVETLQLLLRNDQGQRIIHYAVLWARREAAQAGGYPLAEENRRGMVALAATAGVFSLLFHWVDNGCRESVCQMADYVVCFLSQPMLPKR